MNTITVIGNVGRDPELRVTASGLQVITFSVADTIGKDDKKTTVWHDIKAFGEQAENVAARVTKGQRVVVIGRLNKEKYTGKDGVEKQRVEIIADDVCLSLRWAERPGSSRASVDEEPF